MHNGLEYGQRLCEGFPSLLFSGRINVPSSEPPTWLGSEKP